MIEFSTILCCLNLNEHPEELVPYVRDLIRNKNTKLIITHVLPDHSRMSRTVSDEEYANKLYQDGAKRVKEEVLAFAAHHFADLSPTVEIMEGNYKKTLLTVVDRYCADILVIGSMSSRGPLGFLFNREADSIIGRTRIPVLVIPNDLNLECIPDF